MNRKNIFQRYLFRKDFFWKVKEKLFWFIRNNSRNAFKDQKMLLNNLENGVILDGYIVIILIKINPVIAI